MTNKKILGRTIGSLALAERYGVNISRVVRSGFKFTGRLDLRIKFADKLMVVGPAEGIEAAAKELGNSLTALDHPEVLPAFLGIFLGVIVGSIPIALPGMPTPLKLGLAGGPLIVSILLSRKRKIGPLNFFMANSANLMLREFGLTLCQLPFALRCTCRRHHRPPCTRLRKWPSQQRSSEHRIRLGLPAHHAA